MIAPASGGPGEACPQPVERRGVISQMRQEPATITSLQTYFIHVTSHLSSFLLSIFTLHQVFKEVVERIFQLQKGKYQTFSDCYLNLKIVILIYCNVAKMAI